MRTAGDVMSHDLVLIEAVASVADASRKMELNHLHSLLVKRADGLDSFGIVTSSDIIRKVLAHGKDPAQVAVREVMSKPVITIPPDCSLFDVARLMACHHVNHLPVYDGNELIGIVSSTDIFHARQD